MASGGMFPLRIASAIELKPDPRISMPALEEELLPFQLEGNLEGPQPTKKIDAKMGKVNCFIWVFRKRKILSVASLD